MSICSAHTACRLDGRAGLKFEGRVLNLFGQLTTLNVDQRQFLDARIRPAVSAFAVCGTDYACATDMFTAVQTTTQPNSRFRERKRLGAGAPVLLLGSGRLLTPRSSALKGCSMTPGSFRLPGYFSRTASNSRAFA